MYVINPCKIKFKIAASEEDTGLCGVKNQGKPQKNILN